MRKTGSVLIVVLGLLAILAVVGITFVTMSSIDRSTASNFALQTQFDLAADGAVEFACHSLFQDLWELRPPPNRDYTSGGMLMSGLNKNVGWDAPGVYTTTGANDPWLADTVEPGPPVTVPTNLSFGGPVVLLYGLPFRGTAPPTDPVTGKPLDNLGAGAGNGIWLPELAFPYESGLIRASITIQDHASLINLNAHGNKGVTNAWPLADLVGWGYFISDVNPDPASDGSKVNMTRLLIGDTSQPGRWGLNKNAPGNPNIGEILFENPAAARKADGTAASEGDYPLNLDEEFDLRRIPKAGDPTFPSRVGGSNPIILGLADPKLRLAYTTVGWTSEVRSDRDAHMTAAQGNSTPPAVAEGAWSARKADLNFDTPTAIQKALYCGRTCAANSPTTWGGQFAANVAGFRDGSTGCGIKGYDLVGAVAASRQPILSKVSAQSVPNGSGGNDWTITVQVVSPWGSDTYQNENGLTTSNMRVQINDTDVGLLPSPTMQALTPTVITKANLSGGGSTLLTAAITSIKIVYLPANYGTDVILDQLEPEDIALLASSNGIYRPIFTELESRGTNDPSPVTVLYVGPWAAPAGDVNTFTPSTKSKTSGIPIRFPRSVPTNTNSPWLVIYDPTIGASNLPPRASVAGKPFKAIARLGDIDQILCPTFDKGSSSFWPWVTRVAKAAPNAAALTADIEANFKFNWKDSVLPGGTNVSRLNAANVLAIGGPWQDNIDNDGDGINKMDSKDLGTGNVQAEYGRFAGPELRVAGKINLNTATTLTLQAMESGLGISGLSGPGGLAAARNTKAFASTAETLSLPTPPACTVPNPNNRSLLEQRDEAFNRISNIASIRSDTYSIYGTVQYIDPVKMKAAGSDVTKQKLAIIRTRRFWALADRSPSLAYQPSSNFFIHPRIMNFQWMK